MLDVAAAAGHNVCHVSLGTTPQMVSISTLYESSIFVSWLNTGNPAGRSYMMTYDSLRRALDAIRGTDIIQMREQMDIMVENRGGIAAPKLYLNQTKVQACHDKDNKFNEMMDRVMYIFNMTSEMFCRAPFSKGTISFGTIMRPESQTIQRLYERYRFD